MERTEKMARLFEAGKTFEDIGSQFQLSRQRVQQILAPLGYNKTTGGKFMLGVQRRAKLLEKRDQRYIRLYGFSFDQMAPFRRDGSLRKFIIHRKHAKARGIGWQLSFAEWWDAWQQSGYWQRRGRGTGYCMARNGDAGPYAIGNIYFCTGSQNTKDGFINKPASGRKRRNRKTI